MSGRRGRCGRPRAPGRRLAWGWGGAWRGCDVAWGGGGPAGRECPQPRPLARLQRATCTTPPCSRAAAPPCGSWPRSTWPSCASTPAPCPASAPTSSSCGTTRESAPGLCRWVSAHRGRWGPGCGRFKALLGPCATKPGLEGLGGGSGGRPRLGAGGARGAVPRRPGELGAGPTVLGVCLRLQVHQQLREELAKVKTLEGVAAVSQELKLRCQARAGGGAGGGSCPGPHSQVGRG